MKTRILWLIPVLISAILISGCSPKAKYERRLKHELASGVRYDTLFMGLYFGMPQKDFYTQCWKLNMQGIIRQGPSNTSVQYHMKDELKHPGTMNFYPGFVDSKIAEMPVKFLYNGWAPWNKTLSADSLQVDVLQWFEKMYGDGFMQVDHPKRGSAYVKLDGNRRITIFKENEMQVWAVFSDMSVLKAPIDSLGAGNTTKEIINGLK